MNGYMTLREIKAQIIEFLGLSISSSAHQHDYQECNCAFARQIHQRGHWEKIDCQGHVSTGGCSYYTRSNQIPMSMPCELCSQPISDHEDEDTIMQDQNVPCRAKLFIRTDTSCGHVLHSRCLDAGFTWSCPPSCLACKFTGGPPIPLAPRYITFCSLPEKANSV